jgi:hypothetical protein
MKKSIHILGLMLLLLSCGITLKSSAQKFTKHEIKAAFVYNIIRFVNWDSDKSIITIGVIGNNTFTPILKSKLTNGYVNEKNIRIIHFQSTPSHQLLAGCDVLYVAENDLSINVNEIFDSTTSLRILTISERDSFCEKGGIIQFVEGNNGNYRFMINQSYALKKEIQISSKLLKLAIKVL